ncbi:MAG: MauE/DoxX family redox-associated membrane protein [Halioglobus sp.]
MSLDISLSLVIRCLLAGIFVRAAVHKIHNPGAFRGQLKAYRLLPDALVPAFCWLLPAAEVAIATGMLVPTWPYPPLLGALLLLLYAAAMGINLGRGRVEIDCGCGGPADWPQGISWHLVARNVALAGFALVAAQPTLFRDLSMLEIASTALASCAVLLVYGAIDQALVNTRRHRRYVYLREQAITESKP